MSYCTVKHVVLILDVTDTHNLITHEGFDGLGCNSRTLLAGDDEPAVFHPSPQIVRLFRDREVKRFLLGPPYYGNREILNSVQILCLGLTTKLTASSGLVQHFTHKLFICVFDIIGITLMMWEGTAISPIPVLDCFTRARIRASTCRIVETATASDEYQHPRTARRNILGRTVVLTSV